MYKILMFNDQRNFNVRYRGLLIDMLEDRGRQVISLGYFDSFLSFFRSLYFLLFVPGFVVSSNMKSNLFSVIVYWRRGLIILNGLGRFRLRQSYRTFLIYYFGVFGRKKKFAIQNYLDYRFFRRYSDCDVMWTPGSGGVVRTVGTTDNFVIVTRDEKFPFLESSVLEFYGSKALQSLTSRPFFTIVGLKRAEIFPSSLPGTSLGYLDQERILESGRWFLQPSGYGEGIPHTLVDAVVSGMLVILKKDSYLQYGFNKLGISYESLDTSGWIALSASADASLSITAESVNGIYYSLVEGSGG
jgi:hypothetical protein